MMLTVLKIGLLAIYAMAAASLAGWLPAGLGSLMVKITAVTVFIHVVEVVVMFRHVRLYRGPLLASVALTLLFGLLHWKPLADAKAKSGLV